AVIAHQKNLSRYRQECCGSIHSDKLPNGNTHHPTCHVARKSQAWSEAKNAACPSSITPCPRLDFYKTGRFSKPFKSGLFCDLSTQKFPYEIYQEIAQKHRRKANRRQHVYVYGVSGSFGHRIVSRVHGDVRHK